ncbi:MAG: ABC transporter ATP-binding protein [Myxococcota bacterium]|nr:ABC transporter ATP-binding protein [Myxococcota bacterium]
MLLEVKEIELSFSGLKALNGVSLTVGSEEMVAVIGPNGAGKTSLFNCISGLYRPQKGSIHFDGRNIGPLPPHEIARLGVARTFQNLALFEYLTVLENLQIGSHIHFKSHWWQDLLWARSCRAEEVRHRRRVEEVIDFLDLEKYREMPVSILPYGVLKRVELGRALCMNPKLLLLDEPAAGLNQEATEDLARYILDIKEELKVGLLLIEHDLRFVLELADKVTVLDFGAKIADGLPHEVARHPEVVAAYSGVGGEVGIS